MCSLRVAEQDLATKFGRAEAGHCFSVQPTCLCSAQAGCLPGHHHLPATACLIIWLQWAQARHNGCSGDMGVQEGLRAAGGAAQLLLQPLQ